MHGYMVAWDGSDHFVEAKPFLLPQKSVFHQISRQIYVAMNSLMELVDLVQERKRERVADSRGEKNYAIWQQLTFRLD